MHGNKISSPAGGVQGWHVPLSFQVSGYWFQSGVSSHSKKCSDPGKVIMCEQDIHRAVFKENKNKSQKNFITDKVQVPV